MLATRVPAVKCGAKPAANLLSYINKVNNDILIHKRPLMIHNKFINYESEYHRFSTNYSMKSYDMHQDVLADYCERYPNADECRIYDL